METSTVIKLREAMIIKCNCEKSNFHQTESFLKGKLEILDTI